MATRRNTGTYLFVKDGQLRTHQPVASAAVSVAPAVFPSPGERLRVRRRAVALKPAEMDPRLLVWLEPHAAGSLRIYDAANALVETFGAGRVLIAPAGPGADARTTSLQLAAAAAAQVRTVLIDATDDGPALTELLGLDPDARGLREVLEDRRVDPTAPIDLLGIGRGLDLLPRGAGRHPRTWVEAAGVVAADVARYAKLVLISGPSPDHADFALYTSWADAVVLVGRRDQLETSDAPPGLGRRRLGHIVTRAPA